jgi:hypothetical protein
MPVLSLCPATFDIFVHHGDETAWTFTIKGPNGQPIGIADYTFDLAIDEVEEPEDPETEVFTLSGTVTNAAGGVVEFQMSGPQSETDAGRYYYRLTSLDLLSHAEIIATGRFIFVDSCDTNMVSDVDICNMALGFLGDTARITNITPPDQSTQAQLCAKFYPIALRSTLEMHNWAFATRRTECVATTVTEAHDHSHDMDLSAQTCDCAEWEYFYQLPRHFLKAIAVLPHESINDYSDSRNFSVQLDSTGIPRLYTDEPDAVLLYTEYVVETHLFPPLFQVAVAWHLASMLAGPIIKGNTGAEESKRCLQMMSVYVSKAAKTDSEVRRVHPEHTASWIMGR